jgi:response regulator NasT
MKRILIVDDDRLVLTGLQRDLEPEGYEVLTAESGETAIETCRENPPDLALLDIRMPGMTGMELARRLRTDTDIAFVFLTAYDDRDLVAEAVAHGALGYLVKPLDIRQVVPQIESALARASDLQAVRRRETTLTTALAGKRIVSAAVGIIMERHRLSFPAAFEVLRANARAERRKIEELAGELVQAVETLNDRNPASRQPK